MLLRVDDSAIFWSKKDIDMIRNPTSNATIQKNKHLGLKITKSIKSTQHLAEIETQSSEKIREVIVESSPIIVSMMMYRRQIGDRNTMHSLVLFKNKLSRDTPIVVSSSCRKR